MADGTYEDANILGKINNHQAACRPMCDLSSIMTNQDAIRRLFRAINSSVGNLQPMFGISPDYPAPVARNADGERERVMMRWGMPPPPKSGGPPVTNIRNATDHGRGMRRLDVRAMG
jgi:putative SOS response-associated peptidase YedK